jgi:hypothetical protein
MAVGKGPQGNFSRAIPHTPLAAQGGTWEHRSHMASTLSSTAAPPRSADVESSLNLVVTPLVSGQGPKVRSNVWVSLMDAICGVDRIVHDVVLLFLSSFSRH